MQPKWWPPGLAPTTNDMTNPFYRAYKRTFISFPHAYVKALEIAARVGSLPFLRVPHKMPSKGDAPFVTLALSYPYFVGNIKPSDIIRNALQLAQVSFMYDHCKSHALEPALNSAFLVQLKFALRTVQKTARPVTPVTANIWQVSHEPRRMESKIGGDFSLIFEAEDPLNPSKTRVFAICLQAKCFDSLVGAPSRVKFDIRRFKNEPRTGANDGYKQFRNLKATAARGIRAAYILFNNGPEIKNPVLPLVKDLSSFEDDIQLRTSTNISFGCMDLASYFSETHTLSNLEGVDGADGAGVEKLISSATANNPEYVMCASTSEAFSERVALILRDNESEYEQFETFNESVKQSFEISTRIEEDGQDFPSDFPGEHGDDDLSGAPSP